MQFKFLLVVAITMLCNGLSAQTIPIERTVNWAQAGLEPGLVWSDNMRTITDYGGVADGVTSNNAAVQTAISSLNGQPGIIYFPAGNYFFNNTINLTNGVVLKGESATSSTLRFNLGGAMSDCIRFSGSQTGVNYPLSATGLAKDSYELTTTGSHALSVGDFVQIQQDDNGTYMFSDWAKNNIAQVDKVKAIDGQKITLEYALRRTFDAALNPRIQKLNMVQQAGVECLHIVRQEATAGQTTHISFNYSANCKVKNCWVEMCNFALIDINQSTSMIISGNYFYNAFDWGDGGKAYGVAIQSASGQVLVENNIFRLMRHSVLIQSGANGNVAAYNYSRESKKQVSIFTTVSEDLVCHGNYPYSNLLEGNIVGSIKMDDSHGANGKFNTVFRNRTQNALGISVTNASSNSQNIVGNQITANGAYSFSSSDHFLHGNNRNGSLTPANTGTLPDQSYYLTSQPSFWDISDNWYGIGYPATATNTSIPALSRYNSFISSGSTPTGNCTDQILPLKLIYFKGAEKDNGYMTLQWEIETAALLQNIILQKSLDGNQFTNVFTQNNMQGNSFTYTDQITAAQLNNSSTVYYRILLKEKSGSSLYSNVVAISRNKNLGHFKIWPNPVFNTVHIANYDLQQVGTLAKIISAEGKTVKHFTITLAQININVSGLPAGIYLVKFANGDTGKFVK